MKPKLRAVQPSIIEHEGHPYLLLTDPLKLADGTVAVPQVLTPLLMLCDGTRDVNALRAGFESQTGVSLNDSDVTQLISHLDSALLLDNDRFTQARDRARDEYRAAPSRLPSLAGGGYPANPDELGELLNQYIDAVCDNTWSNAPPQSTMRGLISPHIDFMRGGRVYARAWHKAAATIATIDLAIILGTDHLGGQNLFSLTRQDYATPWGILPTARDIVDQLAEAIGPDIAFQDELHHRSEHSIELALVWLHHFLGGRQIELLPVLCGSFDKFISGGDNPNEDAEIEAVVDILKQASKTRRTLVIAAADLAHMGPAFGDIDPLDAAARDRAFVADGRLVESMCSADAASFYSQIKQEEDCRRICGLSPIYLALRVLEGSKGLSTGYEQCPADAANGSIVSICGAVLP